MSDPGWTCRYSDSPAHSGRWNVMQDGQWRGIVVPKNDGKFSAFLKTNEYASGDFIGQFDTVLEAVTGIKAMELLQ